MHLCSLLDISALFYESVPIRIKYDPFAMEIIGICQQPPAIIHRKYGFTLNPSLKPFLTAKVKPPCYKN